jgi:hypothetical protein
MFNGTASSAANGVFYGGGKADDLWNQGEKKFNDSKCKKDFDEFKKNILEKVNDVIAETSKETPIPISAHVQENFTIFVKEMQHLLTAFDNTLNVISYFMTEKELRKENSSIKRQLEDVPPMINPSSNLFPVRGRRGKKNKKSRKVKKTKSKTKRIKKNKKNKTGKKKH